MDLATTTFTPTEIPMKRFTIRFVMLPVEPMAAMEVWPEKRPTTIVSAALKNICSNPERSIGMANMMIDDAIGPLIMSILFFFISAPKTYCHCIIQLAMSDLNDIVYCIILTT